MPVTKLKDYLDGQHVKYVVIPHLPEFTAQEIAASAHIHGKDFAKTVMVKADGKLAMAVVPASHKVSLEKLRNAVGAQKIDLASEQEFKDKFPDCELGSMPPFGNLYDMEVCVSETLSRDNEIAFNACSHTEVIQLQYQDFERLVHPKVAKISLQESR